MKIIVTGGCGFIGSHLVDRLVGLGCEVSVIDNLSATENEKFYFNEKAQYFQIDIIEKEKMETIFKETDYVFHLAAESRIQPAINNPVRAFNINVMGSLNILELSKKYNIKRVIFSSTSSVYGITESLPTKESNKIFCLNPYSQSKHLAEQLFLHYSNIYNLDTAILRYFNVFGERSPIKGQYAPVVGIFLNQFKNNLPLTIVSDGSRKRDFIYVQDVVKANIDCMNYPEKLNGKIFNVGYGKNFSIKELADVINKNQIFLPDRIGEADNTLADTTMIKTLLNFEPKTSVIDWIKNQIT